MNEYERAIEWINSGMWPQDFETTEMLGVIIAALRAQAERMKGCVFCVVALPCDKFFAGCGKRLEVKQDG